MFDRLERFWEILAHFSEIANRRRPPRPKHFSCYNTQNGRSRIKKQKLQRQPAVPIRSGIRLREGEGQNAFARKMNDRKLRRKIPFLFLHWFFLALNGPGDAVGAVRPRDLSLHFLFLFLSPTPQARFPHRRSPTLRTDTPTGETPLFLRRYQKRASV